MIYKIMNYETGTYSSVYCSDAPTTAWGGSDKPYRRDNIESSWYAQENPKKVDKLRAIVEHSYPYISYDKMMSEMDAADVALSGELDVGQIISATQAAIWQVTNDQTYRQYAETKDTVPDGANTKRGEIRFMTGDKDTDAEYNKDRDDNYNNISTIKDYLLTKCTASTRTDNQYIISSMTADAIASGNQYIIQVYLNAKVGADDTIKVELSNGDYKESYTFTQGESSHAFTVSKTGTYTATLSGTDSVVKSVYFYTPADRYTTQSLIGAGTGDAKVNATASIEIKGKKLELSLTKKESGTDHNLAGAVFSLYRKGVAGGADTLVKSGLTTGANGKITVELNVSAGVTAADYYFVETKAPDGYKIDPENNKFDSGDIVYNTAEKGSLTIAKQVVGGGAAAASKTYTFTIAGPSGTFTETITGAGSVTLKDLKPGTYTVTEADASIEGFDWKVTGTGSVTVKAGKTASANVTNTYTDKPGSLTITKAVSGGGPEAAGKTYTFKITGPNNYSQTVTIKGAGTATLNDLTPGSYTVTEADADIDGYSWTASGKDGVTVATVNRDANTDVTVTNAYERKYGDLTFDKSIIDLSNTAPGEKFDFTVTFTAKAGHETEVGSAEGKATANADYNYNGEKIIKVTLCENDKLTIKHIPVGTSYTIHEDNGGKVGWKYAEDVSGSIAEGTNSRTITNEYVVGDLTLEKKVKYEEYSAVPNPDEVFTFEVTLDGGTQDWGTSDQSGVTYQGPGVYTFKLKAGTANQLTLSGIPVGTEYTVEETGLNTKTGYSCTAPTAGGTITLDSDGNAVNKAVTITNDYFEQRYIDVTVAKEWTNAEKALMPDSITVQLVKNGTPVEGATVELNEANSWSYTWTGLEEYDGANLNTYTVVETAINYTSKAADGTNLATEDKGNGLYLVVNPDKTASNPTNKELTEHQLLGGWRFADKGTAEKFYSTSYNKRSTSKLVIGNTWIPAGDIGKAGFTLRKLDDDKKTPIKGVEFDLVYPDGNTITDVTDEKGEIVYSGLPDGKYVLSEANPAEGWHNDLNTLYNYGYTFEVKYDKVDLVDVHGATKEEYNWTNEWEGWIEGDVKSDKEGNGLFTLYNKVNRFNIELYKVVSLDGENGNNRDYLKNVSYSFLVTGTGVNGEKYEYTYHLNQANNWHVTVQGLPYGTYRVVENVRIPVPYYDYVDTKFTVDGDVKKVTTGPFSYEFTCDDDTNGAVVKVTATNNYTAKKVSIDLSKTVRLDDNQGPNTDYTKTNMAGAQVKFQVTGVDVNDKEILPVKEVTVIVDENGNGTLSAEDQAKLKNLPVGVYTITETQNTLKDYNFKNIQFVVPDNITVMESQLTGTNPYVVLDLRNGESTDPAIDVQATNYMTAKNDTKVTIHKDVKLDGTVYGGDVVKEKFTFSIKGHDLNGREIEQRDIEVEYGNDAVFENLPYGTYQVMETYKVNIENYDTGETKIDGKPVAPGTWSEEFTVGQAGAKKELTFGVTNEYTRKLGDLSVKKVISGNNMDYNSKYDFTIALRSPTEDNTPNYVGLKDTYTYTVTAADGSTRTGTITRFVPGAGTGNSAWSGGKEFEGRVGEDETVTVNGETYYLYRTIEALGNGDVATVTGLPVGTKWHVVETRENEGYSTGYQNQDGVIAEGAVNNTVVTNSSDIYTSVSVQKVWVGDTENLRPASITVQLLRNGQPMEGKTEVLNASNGWRASWSGLPYGSRYSVSEVGSYPGYTSTVTGDGSGTTVNITLTNTYDERTDNTRLRVNKVWVGDDPFTRPNEVTVQLLRNGQPNGTVTLSESNGWTYEWTGLDASATYDVEEVSVPAGYTFSKTQDGRTYTITNTYDTTIPDEDIPLTDLPENDIPLADLPDDDIPLAEIPDDEIPLDEAPQTGDNSRKGLWLALAICSAFGMAISGKLLKTKEEDQGDGEN